MRVDFALFPLLLTLLSCKCCCVQEFEKTRAQADSKKNKDAKRTKTTADQIIRIIKRFNELTKKGGATVDLDRKMALLRVKFNDTFEKLSALNAAIAAAGAAAGGARGPLSAEEKVDEAKRSVDKKNFELRLKAIEEKQKEIAKLSQLRTLQFDFARSAIRQLQDSMKPLTSKIKRLENEKKQLVENLAGEENQLVRNTHTHTRIVLAK
jgi:hypothetical protein